MRLNKSAVFLILVSMIVLNSCSYRLGNTKRFKTYYDSGELKSKGKKKFVMVYFVRPISGLTTGRAIYVKDGIWHEYAKNGELNRTVIYAEGEEIEVLFLKEKSS